MSWNDKERIRALNDELRKHLIGGNAVMTPGIAALGADNVRRLVLTLSTFDDFCADNDPYGEHDSGAFQFEGANVLWKIDYYDRSLTSGSPDPANSAVTERVLTLMLAHEY